MIEHLNHSVDFVLQEDGTWRADEYPRDHTTMRSSRRMGGEMPKRNTVYYVARYEDRAKIDAEARRIGWAEGDGSLMDEIEVNNVSYLTGRVFNERAAAVEWLAGRINTHKTFFGCGDVIEYTTVKSGNRCRYCTCQGEKQLRSWRVEVDADGTADLCDEHHHDDCWAEGYEDAA